MKSRKSFLSLGIIVIVLFLGVGYAVVSSVYLNIGGTASVANTDLKVEITNVVATTNVAEKVVDFSHTLSNKKLTSNFTLNGMELNEVVTITYTVTNNEKDVDATLELASGVTLNNLNPAYFKVNYEIADNSTDLKNSDNTMTVVVTVELYKTPVAEANSSTTVELSLTAKPAGSNLNNDFIDNDNLSDESIILKNVFYTDSTGNTNYKIGLNSDNELIVLTDTISEVGSLDSDVLKYENNELSLLIKMKDTLTGTLISEEWLLLFKVSDDKKTITTYDGVILTPDFNNSINVNYTYVRLANNVGGYNNYIVIYEPEMTWEEWKNSEYFNGVVLGTVEFSFDEDGYIFIYDLYGRLTYDDKKLVKATDKIIEKYQYYRSEKDI